MRGFRSCPVVAEGVKARSRADTFADHYSQARQFYHSQTDIEQGHIAAAFVFELTKLKKAAIRTRMLAHLLNVDETLARKVAAGLRAELPAAAPPARPVIDLAPSPALSILRNGPKSFEGRVLGVLVGEGADAAVLDALRTAVTAAKGTMCIVAPRVGGVTLSDGELLQGDEKIDGGPSVLFDAVAVLLSEQSAAALARNAAAREWVATAYAHLKYIAYNPAARLLLAKAGIAEEDLDAGCINLERSGSAKTFVNEHAFLRYWPREKTVSGDEGME